MAPNHEDPRRPNKIHRYKPFLSGRLTPGLDDCMADYTNLLAMVASMVALVFRFKWCAWIALYGSSISFANCKESDDKKQIISSFMLSLSAVVMCYIHDPSPLNFSFLYS